MADESARSSAPVARVAWVTWACIAASVLVAVGLLATFDGEPWDPYSRFGHLPATRIWNGAYWALLTSVFVHSDLMHLGVNVYWLWKLGTALERGIGSAWFLVFVAAAGAVSSAFELAVSGDTGVGASGVVYAIAGFMWAARGRYPDFARVLSGRTARLLIAWLFLCVLVTAMGIWAVGNAAHASGLAFGLLLGVAVVRSRPRRRLPGIALGAMVCCAAASLFWAPWSTQWLRHMGYEAHARNQIDKALGYYHRVLAMDPSDAWAHFNRGSALATLGRLDEAGQAYARASRLDSQYEAPDGFGPKASGP